MKNHLVGHKIVQLASTIRRGAISGSRIEGKFWRQFWKHPYDKFVRGSITAGGVVREIIYNDGASLSGDAEIPFKKKYPAGKPYKARGRRKRYSSRCSPVRSKAYYRRR